MRFDELAVGQAATLERTVSDGDVVAYAGITGDDNPVHLDEVVAAKSRFGGRIAHGMLSAGFISATIGTRLPGPGSIYLGQTLKFTAPVRIGDTVTTRVEVLELVPEKKRAKLGTRCVNQHGETVIDGDALVMVPDE